MATKTLYHGELRGMGLVQVLVKSDVLESKYAGKPPYVALEIGGVERTYNCENDACADFFEGQKGVLMTIKAEGTKDDATIGYCGEPAAQPDPEPEPEKRRNVAKPPQRGNKPPQQNATRQPQPQPRQRPATQPQPEAQPQPVTQPRPPHPAHRERTMAELVEAVDLAKKTAAQFGNAILIAFQAGLHVRKQIRDRLNLEISEDQFRSFVSSIAVKLDRDGLYRGLPGGSNLVFPPTGDRMPDEQPKPQPEPSDNDGHAS